MTEFTPAEIARAAFVDGLHQIADFLAEHPEVPLPYLGGAAALWDAGYHGPSMPIYLHGTDTSQRAALATIARAMGSAEKATDRRDEPNARFYVWRVFAGIALVASAERDEVCDRVVVGTREETKEILDPDALAAVPKVTVTKTVEQVEWVCTPLLRPAATGLQFVEVPA
jgi:hypothetical protein